MRSRFIERCGHFPREERPEETGALMLRFLEELDARNARRA